MFLKDLRYTNWCDCHSPSLLWISVYPGCSKSVLSEFLVDNKLQATETRTTCYFFSKEDNEDRKTTQNILRALFINYLSKDPIFLGYAMENFVQNGEDVKSNIDLLWSIITTASKDPQAGEIICNLGALDESTESEETHLLKICSKYRPCA